jgi:hypothetical protein
MQVESSDVVSGGDGPPDGMSVLDFWRWAFADLCDDDVKGWFAEWLVGLLLGLPQTRRISWAGSDHVTPEGVRIEVKASAYWQSWKLIEEDGTAKLVEAVSVNQNSRVAFGSLRSKDVAIYRSDLYIFAFQRERDPTRWNALDLTQWEFYALTRDQLAKVGTRSISLATLGKLCSSMSAADFRVKGKAMVQALASTRLSEAGAAS